MKNISKLLGIAVMITVIGLSFNGCMSAATALGQAIFRNYGVFDDSVPADQQAELRFMNANITSFNGRAVTWGRGYDIQGFATVPAGTNTFVFNWIGDASDGTGFDSVKGPVSYMHVARTAGPNNITFTDVEMVAGHKYMIGGARGADGKLITWLYDMTNMPYGYFGDSVGDPPVESNSSTEFEGTWKNMHDMSFQFAGNTWLQILPPLSGENTEPREIRMKGTFVSSNGTLTLYVTDQSVGGRNWMNLRPFKIAYIYKYSFSDNNLLLELPFMLPEMAYAKQ